ncbi:hypothetical protein [Blastococcus capsensis]|uniref:hypothetical protein n=1 Tax=Blastococcus capsensis TaxID=1564163 RepID=UPI00253FB6F3|nr:hypothetical protein [Blastococcus capsensis]MDK3258671.1 hypothetical protein [Blastococcus capsensis]
MTTFLFLLLLLLVLRSLGHPAAGPFRDPPASWSEVAHRLAGDALAGVRVLSRLDATRRDRAGRPWC